MKPRLVYSSGGFHPECGSVGVAGLGAARIRMLPRGDVQRIRAGSTLRSQLTAPIKAALVDAKVRESIPSLLVDGHGLAEQQLARAGL
jgi:hypothetical protein